MNSKLLLAIGVALTSSAALAQDRSNQREQTQSQGGTELPSVEIKADFGSLDANRNQALSMDEVKSNSALSQAFSRLDGNKDGELTNAEFARFESEGSEGSAQGSAEPADGRAKAKGKAEKDDTDIEEKIESGND